MKQAKLLLLTATITLSAFAMIVYSSCHKDPCNGVNCQNGGACSGGTCSCPTGYTGVYCQNSTIVFENDTYTSLNFTFNGSNYTVDANSSSGFAGASGTSISVTNIYTAGAFGTTITWPDFSATYPTGGNGLTEPFSVSSEYFYLYINNSDPAQSIVALKVNYSSASQTDESVSIPNNGVTYGIGYYLAYGNTELYAVGTSGYFTSYPSIPNVANESYTWYVN